MTVGSANVGLRGGNRAGDRTAHNSDPPKATIAVLDDDLLFRASIARNLRSAGYDVIEVEEEAELAAALAEFPVDLILADSRLADGSDGWLVAKRLSELHGAIPWLAMTSYDSDAIVHLGGIDVPHVVKQGAGMNVIGAVEDALSKR